MFLLTKSECVAPEDICTQHTVLHGQEFRDHPKTQTMQTADCRLQTADCRLQTAVCRLQTVQTGYFFFLTLDSLFSVLQLQSSVQYILMLVIYPQAVQTPHSTVVSIDIRV